MNLAIAGSVSVAAKDLVSATPISKTDIDAKIAEIETELKTGKDKNGNALNSADMNKAAEAESVYKNTETNWDKLKQDGVVSADDKVDFSKIIEKAKAGDTFYQDIFDTMTQTTADTINKATQENKAGNGITVTSGELDITF